MKGYLYTVVAAVGLSALSAMVSCSRESGLTLNDQTDSLSYVVGMNIAYNIMKMDSTLRPEVVCAAIDDALSGREMLSAEDAKTYFLAYMNYGAYERTRAYEEQYLSDLEKSDRDIVRTRSGLTYKVEELGDMNRAVTSNRDTVAIRYTIESIDGGQIYSSYERGDTLRAAVNRLTDGLGEGVQLVGEGGKLIMWIPSALGYGAMGNEELGVKPNQMLRYEVEVVEVNRRR